MSNETTIYKAAKVAHEASRMYCRALGDFSQPTWDNAPQWQRESATDGVRFRVENPDAQPWDSHAEWVRVKLEDGWCYGMIKDPESKTHPCLVPYEELPPEQKAKDAIFIAVVDAVLREGE